ncbi:ankyrin [Sulfurifustis variabilis]|uniref:Ankyrin n=1 Tax=Sulfurifustis variabilis TaxID=1675686 RepID=A0A1B4V5Q2_9GAMM|nr:ankyrin repeat domain-containing protein [Sulfurifustis variabilis]BAU48876.1 ankyrin [Sulfurifustis variabilis]
MKARLLALLALATAAPLHAADPDADLAAALARRDVAAVARAIERGADVNGKTPDGRTALMVAAGAGDAALVRGLLEAGAAVNTTNGRGGTALMYASVRGDLDTVTALLEKGAEVDARASNGWTALMIASASGYADLAAVLVDAGANVDAADIYGWTPLMRAIHEGRTEVVRLLVKRARPTLEARDEADATALHHAAVVGSLESARLLLERGADRGARDRAGRTPAMAAAEAGHGALAELLECKGREEC